MSATAASTFQLGDIFLEFGSQRLYLPSTQATPAWLDAACLRWEIWS